MRSLLTALILSTTCFSQELNPDQLVTKLSDPSYAVRESAEQELVSIGALSIPALERTVRESTDPEVLARATEALQRIRSRNSNSRHSATSPVTTLSTPTITKLPPEEFSPDIGPAPFSDLFESLPPGLRDNLQQFLQPDKSKIGEALTQLFQNMFPEQEVPTTPPEITPPTIPQPDTVNFNYPIAGLSLSEVPPVVRSQLNIQQNVGAVIFTVELNSWAQSQGLKQYDIIVEMEGLPFRTLQDLNGFWNRGGALEIIRNGKQQTIITTKK